MVAELEGEETRRADGFAFVGADGVNSYTRTKILGGEKSKYSGYVSWRTLLDLDAVPGINLNRTSVFFGPGYHAVCYPLPARKKLNVVLFHQENANLVFSGAPPMEPDLPRMLTTSVHLDAIIEAAEGKWGFWPLSTVDQEVWYSGSIGLIGDAAHAMMPFQAQGAAMAIEDAAILAPLLMTEPNAQMAFVRYYALRLDRVQRVARVSDANGRAFHMRGPLAAARNAIIALQGPRGHFRRLDWLYGYDAAPEVSVKTRKRKAS
jgi:salicylate hydroxylase